MENPIWSWGSNKFSALGAGTHKKASAALTRSLLFNSFCSIQQGISRPREVTRAHGSCLAIAAGDRHSAVVLAASKKLYVWGEGGSGQLGLDRNPHVPVSHPAPAQNKLRSTNARIICGFAKVSSLTPTRVSNGREEQAMQRSPKWRTGSSTWESWRSGSLRRSRCEPEPLEP